MQKATLTIATLLLLAPILGGCQLARSIGFQRHERPAEKAAPASAAEQQMALGKRHLDSGQYGLAIEAFSNARHHPDQAAGAYNGLAIAYLQLGRPDLSERFFKQAIAFDPANRSYQTNLTRFYATVEAVAVRKTITDSPALAIADPRRVVTAAIMAVMQQTAARSSGQSAVVIAAPIGRIVRVSDREVAVGTPTRPIVAPDGRRRSPAAVVAAAPVRRLNPDYPVKIGMAPNPVAQAPGAGQYPVRVGISRTKAVAARKRTGDNRSQ